MSETYNYLIARQQAYGVMKTPLAELMVEDLARFCRANETCFHEDPRVHANLEGRREVWLRIKEHLDLNIDKLWERYNPGRPLPYPKGEVNNV